MNTGVVLDFAKSFRDPIYGYIGLTQKEIDLLASPALQRLRRIKQLGNTQLIYPSACHNRFEHSLGVLHMATRMADKLGLSDDEKKIVRYAALLHDIGHGPLSHNFEPILTSINGKEVTHEMITMDLINQDETIDKVLGKDKEGVISLFSEDNETVNHEIISSGIDADRLDYLRRDSYHIGVAYGSFDLERILHTIRRVDENERSYVVISQKGKDAVENFRLARYSMYSQVYQHHTRIICDKMFIRAIQLAFDEGALDKSTLQYGSDDFLKNYLALDDNRMIELVLSKSKSDASQMMGWIESRNLLKRGYQNNMSNIDTHQRYKISKYGEDDFHTFENAVAQACGCNQNLIIADKTTKDKSLYESTNELFRKGKKPVIIVDDNGHNYEIDMVSPFEAKRDPETTLYVLCPKEHVLKVKEIVPDVILEFTKPKNKGKLELGNRD